MGSGKVGATALAALVVAHCAGMMDLVALPVWVGALVEHFGFSPRDAGMLVTMFLLGVVGASLFVAPRFGRMRPRQVTTIGFMVACTAFLLAAGQSGLTLLSALHLVAGLAVGSALSAVHGTMGRTANPHRTFAIAGIALAAFGIATMVAIPQLLIAFGGSALFLTFSAAMLVAAITCAVAFPSSEELVRRTDQDLQGLGRGVWFIILGISAMTLNQAMVFSFVEVIGKARGFASGQVLAVLATLGIVNFVLAAPAAMLLERRLRPEIVVRIGPAVQTVLALIVTGAASYLFWAPAAAMFVGVQIFTHTFAFGLLARRDATGRAVAATPAMLMSGSALGPVLGGTLAESFGYASLGYVAVVIGVIAIVLFTIGASAAQPERKFA